MARTSPLWSLMFTLCWVASWVPASSGNMWNEVKKLKTHYKTNDIALFSGGALFPQDLHDFEETEQRLLLQESLDVYDRILSDMFSHTQGQAIRRSIAAVRSEMEVLRKSYFPGRHGLRERLQTLWALKTDDATTQRKALRELLPLFRAASRLGSVLQERTEKRAL